MSKNARIALLLGMSVPLAVLVAIGLSQGNLAVVASAGGGLIALLLILLSKESGRSCRCGKHGASRDEAFVHVQSS